MSTMRLLALCASMLLGGCGLLAVPQLQDLPGDKVGGQQLVQSIAYNITCEARDSVDHIYNDPDHRRQSTFLDTWGMNLALSLQAEEKSNINPIANWLPPSPPSSVFNLGIGANVASDATRQEKLNSYWTVDKLRQIGPCETNDRPGGILLMQRELGLEDWLRANVIAADTGKILYSEDYSDGPNKTNVLSHEIKFQLTTTGAVTPGWKLSRLSLNQSGIFFSATRDRVNDLIVTLGPTIPTPKPKLDKKGRPLVDRTGRIVMQTGGYAASPAADQAAFASQIGLAVSNALRGNTLPQ